MTEVAVVIAEEVTESVWVVEDTICDVTGVVVEAADLACFLASLFFHQYAPQLVLYVI